MQGLPGTTYCNGPIDVVRKVIKSEGFRGLYRGFGLTALTQSPASALWWGAYGAAQHMIWRYAYLSQRHIECRYVYNFGLIMVANYCLFLITRSLGYGDDMEKPSQSEMITVQASAGMVAGACSTVITTPIDTVKTRLQVAL